MKYWQEIKTLNGIDLECVFYKKYIQNSCKYDCRVILFIDSIVFYGTSYNGELWKHSSSNKAFNAAISDLKFNIEIESKFAIDKMFAANTKWLISLFK